MAILAIDTKTTRAIKLAVERARKRPVPWETMAEFAVGDYVPDLKLSDRKPGFKRVIASQFVDIPFGYRAAISFEEQPAGLMRHLSVSVDRKGMLPSPESVLVIAEVFGFVMPLDLGTGRMWLEEFEPGQRAVNVVQLVEAAP